MQAGEPGLQAWAREGSCGVSTVPSEVGTSLSLWWQFVETLVKVLALLCFHISFANDRMNDGETFMDEVAMWSGTT